MQRSLYNFKKIDLTFLNVIIMTFFNYLTINNIYPFQLKETPFEALLIYSVIIPIIIYTNTKNYWMNILLHMLSISFTSTLTNFFNKIDPDIITYSLYSTIATFTLSKLISHKINFKLTQKESFFFFFSQILLLSTTILKFKVFDVNYLNGGSIPLTINGVTVFDVNYLSLSQITITTIEFIVSVFTNFIFFSTNYQTKNNHWMMDSVKLLINYNILLIQFSSLQLLLN